MIVTDQLKILDDKIKANQAQYDLSREAANISSLSSKDLLGKYEYLTREDLGHKPGVFEKAKFECYPLGMVLANNTKSKTNKNRAVSKQNKTNIWSIIDGMVLESLKILMNLKNLHLILCRKDWMIFRKDIICLKMLLHKQVKIKIYKKKF